MDTTKGRREFHDAEHTIAQDSGDFAEDFGEMPILETTRKENGEFIGDLVGDTKYSPVDRCRPGWGGIRRVSTSQRRRESVAPLRSIRRREFP